MSMNAYMLKIMKSLFEFKYPRVYSQTASIWIRGYGYPCDGYLESTDMPLWGDQYPWVRLRIIRGLIRVQPYRKEGRREAI